jgi:hypothetical protein
MGVPGVFLVKRLFIYFVNSGCIEAPAKNWLSMLEGWKDGNNDKDYQHDRTWPRIDNKFSSDMNRLEPNLKAVGITVNKLRGGKAGRRISICKDK